MLSNIRFLAAHRDPGCIDAATLSRLEGQALTGTRLGDLEDTGVRAAALHLVWRGVLRVDLETPLSLTTQLERAA